MVVSVDSALRQIDREILASAEPLPPEVQDNDELMDLRQAINDLPRRMRLCICLHYLLDLSVGEVASTLSVSSGTVKSNLHDGRRRLRQLMEVET